MNSRISALDYHASQRAIGVTQEASRSFVVGSSGEEVFNIQVGFRHFGREIIG